MTRKEARVNIGLGDIPEDKIEQIVKNKKEKIKNSGGPNVRPVSWSNNTNPRSNVVIKADIPQASVNVTANSKPKLQTVMVKQASKQPIAQDEPSYQYEMNSSINDFDHYMPMYNHTKVSASKRLSNGRTIESVSPNDMNQDQDRMNPVHCKKDLVKIQRQKRLKQQKDQTEKAKLEEQRKNQNLEALNNMLRKKNENYKRKVAVKEIEKADNSLFFEDDEPKVKQRLTVKTNIQSQDNIKFSHLAGSKGIIKPSTSKNSAMGSVNQSITSTLSRRPHDGKRIQKSSIGDESTVSSHQLNFHNRISCEPKFQNKHGSSNDLKTSKRSQKSSYKYGINDGKKSSSIGSKHIKKVISLPSVKLDKKAIKGNKSK